RRVGRRTRLRSSRDRAEQLTVLQLEFRPRRSGLQSEQRRDLHPHADRIRHASAHGTIGLPAGSEAGLRRRKDGLATILRKTGGVFGQAGVTTANHTNAPTQEVAMSKWIRQPHRWVAFFFTFAVTANLIIVSQGKYIDWVGFLALVPLIFLLLTGSYLF